MANDYFEKARAFYDKRQADMKANPQLYLPDVTSENPVGLNYPELPKDTQTKTVTLTAEFIETLPVPIQDLAYSHPDVEVAAQQAEEKRRAAKAHQRPTKLVRPEK